jgi:hypothetical protein
METDLLQLANSSLWMLSILMVLGAAALCLLRGKYLLAVGFGALFALGAFNWLFATFLAEMLMSSTDLDIGAFYQWKGLMEGMLYIVAWLLVCAGLFTALKPAAESLP